MDTIIRKYKMPQKAFAECRWSNDSQGNVAWGKLLVRLSRLGFKVWRVRNGPHVPQVPKAAVSYLGRGPVQDGGPADYTRLANTSGHGEMMRLLSANQTLPRH